MREDQTTFVFVIIFGVLITVALFFLLREVFLWYFKINKRIEQNDRMIELLSELAEKDK